MNDLNNFAANASLGLYADDTTTCTADTSAAFLEFVTNNALAPYWTGLI